MALMEGRAIQGFDLSPQQRRLWALQGGGERTSFWATLTLAVDGALDPQAVAASAARVAVRHEVLRTGYRSLPGMTRALQVIADEPRVHLEERPAEGGLEAWLAGLRAELPLKPVSFESGPLLHLFLGRASGGGSLLTLALPALSADPLSLDLLATEMAAAYAGAPMAEDPEEPLQYADLAALWNDLETSEETAEARLFWRGRPAPVLPARPLPGEGSGAGAFRPDRVTVRLEAGERARLADLAAARRVSLGTVLLAGWQALLSLASDSPELSVWVLHPGRTYDGMAGALGLFARYLPLSAASGEAAPWSGLLAHLDREERELAEWQDYFLLAPPAVPSCAFEPAPPLPAATAGDGWRWQAVDRWAVLDRWRLSLSWRPEGDGLVLDLGYDAGVFAPATAAGLLARLRLLLATLAAGQGAGRVGDLDLLTAAERGALAGPPRAAAPELWHRQVARRAVEHPGRTAVRCGDRALTYGELDARANRLAHHLVRLGVGPETRVGVCLERSLDLPTALLGVLKAGGAFLPLDPAWPAERLAAILSGSDARLVVTQEKLLALLDGTGRQLLALDREPSAWLGEPAVEPAAAVTPEGLAYVLYTSGSTGRPKGVLVSHGGLAHYLAWCAEAYPYGEGEGVPVHSSIGFDLTVTSLLAPLAAGDFPLLLSQDQGLEAVAEPARPFSLVKITPAHLELVAQLLPAGAAARWARALVIGGEALHGEGLDFWRRCAPELAVFNEYGPTEAVVGCCVHRLAAGEAAPGPVPIGRPITGTPLYVLNRLLMPVLPGAAGELWIGGPGLARGYHGLPALTAERFRPDPFAGLPGARMYASGDLVRRWPDGDLEFLGRRDQQLKVRGFRVEPAEVEAALLRHPAVREAAVGALADPGGRQRLVAWVVPREGDRIDSGELAGFLARSLIDAMVPASWVELPALPLTGNGKVDRRALPAPDWQRSGRPDGYAPPRNGVEEVLAEVWAGLLRVERVGIHDDFFRLGGDSILAIQAVARAGKRGVRLLPGQIFEHHTVAELAAVAGTREAAGAEDAGWSGSLPLLPAQAWLLELAPEPHHFNQALLFEPRRPLAPPALAAAAAALARARPGLRLRFSQDGAGWRQMVDPPGIADPFGLLDLSALPEPALERALAGALAALQAGFDLRRGNLFRVVLVRRGEERSQRLLLLAHHMVVDGVSWRVLLEDLRSAYGEACRSEAPSLPLEATSLRWWAQALAGRADGEARSELGYWLAGPRRAVPRLPVDRPGGANVESLVEVVTSELAEAATGELLLQAVPAHGGRIDAFLLAALALAVRAWSGVGRLLVMLEGHGREPFDPGVDLSVTVGWLTSLTPVLLDVEGAEGGAALARVREQLAAVPGWGLGWGLLRYLASDPGLRTELAALPRPEIAFNYLGQLDAVLEGDAWLFPAAEPVGAVYGPRLERPWLLEVNAGIAGRRLCASWRFSSAVYRRATVETLARDFTAQLAGLASCPGIGALAAPALSDFGWTSADLELITGAIRRSME